MLNTSLLSRHRALGAALAASLALASANAWALGSTPVTVVNPDTNPAVTRTIDEPGRAAYQAEAKLGNCGAQGADFLCFAFFAPPPAGHRLVIQHVSGAVLFAVAGPASLVVEIDNQSRPGTFTFPVIPFIPTRPAFDQPVLIYVEAGDNAPIVLLQAQTPYTLDTSSITLSGYILDCTVAACAPIAH